MAGEFAGGAGKKPPLHAVSINNPNDKRSIQQKIAEAYTVPIGVLLDGEAPKVRFLVPGCIPRGNVVLFAGPPTSGKTWLAYDLARAVASGTPWLHRGLACPEGPQTVLFLNYDNPTETLKLRLKKLGFTSDMPAFVHTQGHTEPTTAGGAKILTLPAEISKLKYILEYHKPALVIFDSLRQGISVDENSSKEMAAVMSIFKSWTAINDSTVIILHHTSKNNKNNEHKSNSRGSGEIEASCDAVIQVTSTEIEWTKARTWNIGKTKTVRIDIVDEYQDTVAEREDDGADDELDIDLIERVRVCARSVMPYELECQAIDKVVDIITQYKNDSIVSFKTIKSLASGMDEVAVREALRNARLAGKIRFIKHKLGRGYVLI